MARMSGLLIVVGGKARGLKLVLDILVLALALVLLRVCTQIRIHGIRRGLEQSY